MRSQVGKKKEQELQEPVPFIPYIFFRCNHLIQSQIPYEYLSYKSNNNNLITHQKNDKFKSQSYNFYFFIIFTYSIVLILITSTASVYDITSLSG